MAGLVSHITTHFSMSPGAWMQTNFFLNFSQEPFFFSFYNGVMMKKYIKHEDENPNLNYPSSHSS